RQFEEGRPLEAADKQEISQAKSRKWHLIGWLEQPEAGVDGNALAACLSDILSGVDPEHPRAVAVSVEGEQGKWNGWVAAIDAFKDAEPVMLAEDETADPEAEIIPSTALKLKSASVEIPLWYLDKASKEWILRPVAVSMEANLAGDGEQLLVTLPGEEPGQQQQISTSLMGFLSERHGGVPKGLRLEFRLAGDIPYSEKRNGKALLGALLVLADSALSGELPEAMVLAVPTDDGSLELPVRFWQTIRTLADTKSGKRLVLPLAAKDYMAPLITLDKSEFFFEFEVLLADDAAGLCELASSMPPVQIVEAHQSFEMIREARGSRSLGSFLNHESTQQRLRQVIALVPTHASAQMLALRGTSKWPKRLSKEVFAREIRAAIAPLASFFKPKNWFLLNGEELEDKVDASRAELDAIERLYGSVSDRQELHTPTMNLAKLLSSLAVDAKRSSVEKGDRHEHEAAFREAWLEYVRVVEILTLAAGDSDDYPLPLAPQ
ncbi:hypothetical protein, partial [Haloferula sp.]|uniref:hypothetical protein n=1 Tax=Haloferula sp. TaxID=2497595 RepID=UPI003C753492